MSASRTEQCVSPARASLDRASASIARDASTPTPWLIRRGQQFQHPPGAGADVEQPAGIVLRHQRKQRGLDLGGRQVQRPHLIPIGTLAAKTFRRHAGAFGQHAGSLAAVGLQDLVVLRQPRNQVARQSARLAVGEGEPDIRPLTHAVQQAAVAQQLQVAREARLRLAKDLGELRDAECAAAGQRQQAEAGRFRGGSQAGQQGFHGLWIT